MALHSMQAGFGVGDINALGSLCRTLWVKSRDDEKVFDYCFEQMIREENLFFLTKTSIADGSPAEQVMDIYTREYCLVWIALVLFAGTGALIVKSLSPMCPYLTNRPDLKAVIRQEYSYVAKACKEQKNDNVRISVVDIPPWLKAEQKEDGSLAITGTPAEESAGDVLSLKLSGSGAISENETFLIEVVPENELNEDLKKLESEGFNINIKPISISPNILFKSMYILLIVVPVLAAYALLKHFFLKLKGDVIVNDDIDSSTMTSLDEDNCLAGSSLEASTVSSSLPVLASNISNNEYVLESMGQASKPINAFVGSFSGGSVYFPLARQKLKYGWTLLSKLSNRHLVELDLQATIKQIGKDGSFLKPIFSPRKSQARQILLLVDREGSMTPFHAISKRFIQTLSGEEQKTGQNIFYFHNCPGSYLYKDVHLLNAISTRSFLHPFKVGDLSIVIFSDAGVAHGLHNQNRLNLTSNFIRLIQEKTKRIVWLNPFPKSRWRGTTAEGIQKIIPMFEFSEKGFESAIKLFLNA
ncbi:MAG: hypothetical protein AAFV90_21105 [Cyanobacteria bacterium J06634_5]